MLSPSDRIAYYRAALASLRFVEQRRPTGRRFGGEADARWSALRGDLATADRIDLLVRDANAEWPGAFGARAVFRMHDVAEDDPFGARWSALDAVDGEELWRAVVAEAAPATLGAALDAVAAAWGIELTPLSLGAVASTNRLLVAGPSAIASAVATFAESDALDWRRQVTVVATPCAERQLASLAPAWLQFNDAVRVIAADEEHEGGRGGRRVVVSDDAAPDDRRWALTLGEGKG